MRGRATNGLYDLECKCCTELENSVEEWRASVRQQLREKMANHSQGLGC